MGQKLYELPVSTCYQLVLSGRKNKKVNAGDLLARMPLDFEIKRYNRRIRVAELFEARKPKDYSYISI